MITLTNVSRTYYLDDKTVVEPVKDVSLTVEPGAFVVIIGRSGSGKTTLLNLIAGLIKPSAGTVMVGGLDIRQMGDRQISSFRNKKMGFVFQFPSLIPALTVLDNVILPRDIDPKGGRNVEDKARRLLKTVGLEHRIAAYPKQLSAGEQKRAVIARALINEPEVVLADEPTSDLDEKTEREIMSLLMDIRSSGVTVVMVTHSLRLIPFASRAFKMENSRLTEIPTSGATSGDLFEL
jgi:ABC-type lipoprotein export system ATPase subunit